MSQKISTPVVPMRSVCVGRYLIDVPATVTNLQMAQTYNGITIDVHSPTTLEQLEQVVSKGAEGEKAVADAEPNVASMSLPTDPKIYVFEDGNDLFTLRGAVLSADVGYVFQVQVLGDSVAGAKVAIQNLIRRLEPRDNFSMPTVPGFCIDHGFIAGAPPGRESVTFAADWPEQKAKVTLVTETNADRNEPNLIARMSSLPAPLANLFDRSSEVLRKRSRIAAGRNGDEFDYLDRSSNDLALEWRAGLGEESSRDPALQLRLETTGGAGKASQDHLLAIWDNLVDSLARRGPG